MIVTFEEITHELTEEENKIVPILIKGFSAHTKTNPIKEPDICRQLNNYLAKNDYQIRLTGARLRKFVNYLRVNALLPLIATSKGYFVSYDDKIVEAQIRSLEQRARSIQSCANGLKKSIKKYAQG